MDEKVILKNNVVLFKAFLNEIWKNEKPLCKLFSTEQNNYLYDTTTNVIFKCDRYEFLLLKYLLTFDSCGALDKYLSEMPECNANKAICSIKDMMNQKNIMKLTKITSFGLFHSYESIIDRLCTKLGMIQLEVTEKCNLRCKYCIYNEYYPEKRSHGIYSMNEATALAAVDYLSEHSKEMGRVSIGFYGGEPLLKMELIKRIVDYAKSRIINKELAFTITTNATLITEEIAYYLNKERFNVLVSLDGPQMIHDLWRRDINGRGSFNRTFRGFNRLRRAFKSGPGNLGISMVYAPPYSETKVEAIAQFINALEWIPPNFHVSISYPKAGTARYNMSQENIEHKEADFSLSSWAKKEYLNAYAKNRRSNLLANSIIEPRLAKLMQRPLMTKVPIDMAYLNGCCVPGVRKIFVSVNGEFKLCEKIGKAPSIGRTDYGVDKEIIKKFYLDQYSSMSIQYCSKCWLIRLCPICYQHVFREYEIDMRRKEMYCGIQKTSAVENMKYLCSLLEINKYGLEYLNDWKIS